MEEPWAPIALSVRTNLKVALANAEQPAALGYYVSAIVWSVENGTDGRIPATLVDQICPGVSGRLARACVKALSTIYPPHDSPLLEADAGAWQIHDFGDYQDLSVDVAKRRKANRDRKRKEREEKKAQLLLEFSGSNGQPAA